MKKVFVSGIFNVFHPGHMRLLRFARNLGDKLIVGVISDKNAGRSSLVNEKLRLENLKNSSLVDEAKLIDIPFKKFLQKVKPDVVCKGKEHESKYNIENEVLKKYGGKLVFGSGDVSFSSTDLLRKEIRNLGEKNLELPESYIRRRSLNKNNILKNLEFKKINVCVIGDLIIDKFIECEALGMSREDNTIVVKPMDQSIYLGGAGIVSAHCSQLGAKTFYISVSGKDKNSIFAEKKLKDYGVHAKIFKDDTRPTTLKERYLNDKKSIFRISHVQQRSISLKLQNEIIKYFKKIINKIDALIISDFNYGLLTDSIIKKIITIAKKRKIFIAADSQSSSQIGNVSKYKGIDLITPTENEARVSLKNFQDGIIVIAENLRKSTHVKNIILKLGEEGILIHKKDKKLIYDNDRVQSLNIHPLSTSGAGDCLLAAATLSMTKKFSVWESALIGSIAAAIQISKLGNIPIKLKEIENRLRDTI